MKESLKPNAAVENPNSDQGNRQPRGRRFSEAQKKHALLLLASGVSSGQVASVIGTTVKSVRAWAAKARATGGMPEVPVVAPSADLGSAKVAVPTQEDALQEAAGSSPRSGRSDDDFTSTLAQTPPAPEPARKGSPYAPKDPGQGLSEPEVAAILELKQRHPSYGPAQLRAQLKRFKGWRLSIRAIARVLRSHGYELVHTKSRPQGPEPTRFEAPRRNALWQLDYAELRVPGERFHIVVALDDFSRYAVGFATSDAPSSQTALELVRDAIARHGKPEAIRTDRGGAFMAKEFTEMLEAELIDHVVGRSYHPEGGGKVESLVGTLRRELWDVEHFATRRAAERRLMEFFEHYNTGRAHMGIDGITPADRYFARGDRVLQMLDAVSRKRNGAWATTGSDPATFEEVLDVASGSPMEVLRLVARDGEMELRLCGARVRLGKLEN